eukprot:s7584_g4.t1
MNRNAKKLKYFVFGRLRPPISISKPSNSTLGWKHSLHAGCVDCLHEFLDFFVPWIHASTSASLRACVSSIQAIVIRIVFIIVIMCCFSDNDHDYYIFYHCRLAPRVLG